MASFSFSFELNANENEGNSAEVGPKNNISEKTSLLPLLQVPCPAWVASPSFDPPRVELDFTSTSRSANAQSFRLRKIDIDQHPNTLSSFNVPANHDIVPRRYEGGYKLWECSLDLVQFLLDENELIQEKWKIPGKMRVLELGCGHGLPGAAALALFSPERAVFSDLNEEVLKDTTWANIRLNGGTSISGNSSDSTVDCIAGDWTNLSSWLESQELSFDIILSAETLYNVENCAILANLLYSHLSLMGVAFLATKRYYFGVGGGTVAAVKAIEDNNECHRSQLGLQKKKLACEIVRRFEDGASNIRDIIAVRWVTY